MVVKERHVPSHTNVIQGKIVAPKHLTCEESKKSHHPKKLVVRRFKSQGFFDPVRFRHIIHMLLVSDSITKATEDMTIKSLERQGYPIGIQNMIRERVGFRHMRDRDMIVDSKTSAESPDFTEV